MTGGEGTPVGSGLPPETVRATPQKVLASPHFSNARRLSEFRRLNAMKATAGETA
jgi:hypothetical protein